jgi:ADP-ribosyl-[dinitrogen reductase] hydrolase
MPPPKPPPKKGKGPLGPTDAQLQSRARGSLLGLAVGDALGTTNEFRKMPAPDFPTLCTGVHTEMRGGGPFAVKRGQVTDDTHMACVLANGLRNIRRYEMQDTAKAYAKWMTVAFDVGAQTKAALELIAEGLHSEFAGKRVWIESGQKAAGNGSLMRCAPLGIFYCWERQNRIDFTLQDSQITHWAPLCQLACVVLNAAIAAAMTSDKEVVPKEDVFKNIEAELSLASAQLGRQFPDFVQKVTDASNWLREDIKKAQANDPELYGPDIHMLQMEGYVRVALRLALWEWLHAPTYEAALIDVVNRGGDADTNAAITGALLGAVYGDAAIPERWSQDVLECRPPAPFHDLYHPNTLLTLVGNLPERPKPEAKPPVVAPKKSNVGGGGH